MKIAFVVQRYGEEVNGGAELLCRRIAEHLSKYCCIEVITTCAKDYITWRNEYLPGKDTVDGITVWRFPVDNPRDIHKFNRFSEKIYWNNHRQSDEIEWMKLQGPYSTELLSFIRNNKDNYDFVIFFTYLYCTTFFGLPLVKDKALLVPTAHDEPPIYLSIFDTLFNLPKAIIYSTEEEKRFVNSKFKNENIPSEIIGVGIDVPEKIDADNFKQKYNVDNFIIYVGRIDESKGCKELFEYFLQYKKETQSDIKLVLMGKPVMKVPGHPDIIELGFLSEQDKFNGIKAAKLLIMPSQYESLSMVIMEAWLCNNAVLVNGNCEVLKGQCVKSNGGLYYINYDEFRECLNLLLMDSQLRARMGENGQRYVEENYGWEKIENRWIGILSYLFPCSNN
ncbi:MAG: glycosyltransferase [Candidatus Methanoperedens sp.]|nr:glycosyltransferase [Candidatus Methanoperedens sp.]